MKTILKLAFVAAFAVTFTGCVDRYIYVKPQRTIYVTEGRSSSDTTSSSRSKGTSGSTSAASLPGTPMKLDDPRNPNGFKVN